MDWRRAGSPTYGRRRSAGGIYSAPASPAHPLGAATTTAAAAASAVHPLAARSNSKARAAAAMAHAMSRAAGPRDDDDADHAVSNGMMSPLRGGGYGYGYGGRSPLQAAAAGGGGGGAKDKYFGFALPKVFTRSLLANYYYY